MNVTVVQKNTKRISFSFRHITCPYTENKRCLTKQELSPRYHSAIQESKATHQQKEFFFLKKQNKTKQGNKGIKQKVQKCLSNESCVSAVQKKREDFLSLITSHLLRAPFLAQMCMQILVFVQTCRSAWRGEGTLCEWEGAAGGESQEVLVMGLYFLSRVHWPVE